MADTVPIPMLEGWNNSPYTKLDYLLNCMITTEASQTNFFRGRVHSIQATLSRFKNDAAALQQDLAAVVLEGLTPYFNNVTVDVTALRMEDDDSKLNVEFQINFQQDGERYNARRLAYMVDSKFVKVVTINNG